MGGRRWLGSGLVAVLAALLAGGGAVAASSGVVVSQVYGGGGNTGAQYQNDFIELFNRGTTSISLAGWSVQYASATGTGNFSATPLPNVSLAPGQYFLVRETAGANGVPLPAPDASGSTNTR